MIIEMDMQFAKVAHHPDGRDCLYVEGVLIPLAIEDVQQNNILVDRLVRGLRNGRENTLTLVSGTDQNAELASSVAAQVAA